METYRYKKILSASLLGTLAVTSCSIDSYHTDPSDVHCDDGRTKTDLSGSGMATFIIHGTDGEEPATVTVRREGNSVSVKTEGNITGPPQQLEADGYTTPTSIVEGAELSTFGAGGAWVIDATKDAVIIQGTCSGT